MITKTKVLSRLHFDQINQLWNEEYPLKLKDRFPILLDGVSNYNHFVIENENGDAIAWAVDFEKEEQIRFSIIVASKYKGKGLGSALINRLKEEHAAFYGWVIDHNEDIKANGENYSSPLPFYFKHGFQIVPEKRIDTEMIRAVLIQWQAQ